MAVKYSVANGGFIQDTAVSQAKLIFQVDGDIEIPVETVMGSLLYNKTSFSITTVTSVFETIGTASYTIKIISVDLNGANPVTHYNETVSAASYGTEKRYQSVSIANATIGADRSVKLTVTQGSGTFGNSLSVTLE